MKKNHLFTYSKICALALTGASALFLTSCAEDGFDEESFDGGVSNTQVTSISAEDITITPSADGKSQTISWPVVMGAGGYRVNLIDVSNPDEPIINDSIVDGCTVTGKREEDVNYQLTIQALGNAKKNNTDSPEVTSKAFSTFTPTYMTIPAGSDLNEWFAANPIPEEAIGENLNYDLEAGGEYTVSAELDFDAYWVTLRANSKSNPATIKYTTEASCINFAAPFNAKYLHFDCAAMSDKNGVFGFSKSPTAARDEATGFVIFGGNTTIVNCTFDKVNGYFFWDNRKGQKVAAVQFLIDNCVVELTPSTAQKAAVIWTNNGGHINDFTISNSTFYNLTDGDLYYFYQTGNYRAKDIGLGGAGTDQGGPGNTVTFKNSTFYRIGFHQPSGDWGEWGNYNGMNGKADSFWTMTDCIFFDCSAKGGVPRRFLHGKTYASDSGNVTFANNTYMAYDGSFDPIGSYDTSGSQIEEDPMFANPDAADFTISGATQVARKTGDPRWLP
ncbi:MAG: DUF4957 domain-containing protein [Prevotella sp.]|nr:DUF4957 domain-containing protein [Prevotella sp.]